MKQYSGLKGMYFKKLLRTLIDVGDLNNRRVLDFGCGTQELRKLLTHKNYVGYDIDPKLSDVPTLDGIEYDVMVANEVFYEMPEKDIEEVLEKIRPKIFAVGISRQTILNKIGAALLHPSALDKTLTPPKKELEILLRHYRIVKKKSVWLLADVYLLEHL
jgi:SAM-dependent methyltransferase